MYRIYCLHFKVIECENAMGSLSICKLLESLKCACVTDLSELKTPSSSFPEMLISCDKLHLDKLSYVLPQSSNAVDFYRVFAGLRGIFSF